jgi:hypothetical protein
MYGDSHQNVTIRELIAFQRGFARSSDIFEQVVGVLFAAGALENRLRELNDRQIGRLLSDFVGDHLNVCGPEMTICQEAALRLFRSSVEKLTTNDIENLKRRAECPNCGNEMLLTYGIDEPDYLECTLANCGYRLSA